ncbi:MAG: CBS domain-containing protein [Planctomycetes bacterium]|nr:CBS domain-containing protein [Planctomycetota bacterium]
MATSQTEEATDNKQDSEESGAVQESGGEKSKPQEPAAVEAPVEEAAAEQGAEETQEQKAADDKADSEEKAEAETEAKPEAEAVEEKGKPEAKVESKEKAEAVKEKMEAKPEAAEEPKAEAEEKAKPEVEAKPEAEAVEKEGKPEAEVELDTGYSIPDTRRESSIENRVSSSVPDQSQESVTGEISETIQKMTQSPAVLPGESGKPTAKIHISVSSAVCAKEIMQKEVVWANSEESVQQALTKMQQQDSGYIMIGKDGTLEGIVSKSDITGAASIYMRPIFAKWHGPLDDATLQIKLKWIMSRPVRTVRPETPLATIIENMCRFGGRGLPVMDEQGKVQGLVTVFDIFRALLNTNEDASAVGKTAEAPALT